MILPEGEVLGWSAPSFGDKSGIDLSDDGDDDDDDSVGGAVVDAALESRAISSSLFNRGSMERGSSITPAAIRALSNSWGR